MKLQPIGILIPIAVHELVKRKVLLYTDAFVYGLIEASIKPDEIACWATNKEIADYLGLTERMIAKILKKLRDQGLIKSSIHNRRRAIRTSGRTPLQSIANGSSLMRELQCAPSSYSSYTTYKTHKTQRRGSTFEPHLSVVNEEEKDVGFRPEPPKLKAQPTELDLNHADLLYEAVCDVLNIKKEGWHRLRRSWANELRLLRQSLEDGDRRVSEAIKWYRENCHAPNFQPRISGAAHFRKLFDWVEQQAAKSQRKQVPISDSAKAICSRLKMMRWPKDTKVDLEAAVQTSLDSLNMFKRGLNDLRSSLDKIADSQLIRFCENIISRIGSPENYIEQHFNRVWKSIKNWEAFHGDLMRFALNADGKEFHAIGKGWAADWGGEKHWDNLIRRINARAS